MRSVKFFLAALVVVVCSVVPAVADSILYDNGPQGPDADAWPVYGGYVTADTFTLATAATVTGFQFWAWLFPGDTVTSAEVSITSQAFGGTTYFDQTVIFTSLGCNVNAYGYNVCDESATFHGPRLNAGTYWLNLQNAVTAQGNPVLWDENSGFGCTSPGCPSLAESTEVDGTIPSESFTLIGNSGSGSVPEPGTILLLGAGLVGVAETLRRKLY
jgi:hypothetical protein